MKWNMKTGSALLVLLSCALWAEARHRAAPIKECHARRPGEGVPLPDNFDARRLPSVGYRCRSTDGTVYDQLDDGQEIVTSADGNSTVQPAPASRSHSLHRVRR